MRNRWIFAAVLALAAAFPSNVQAGDGWRVVDTAGVVRVGGPGFMPAALTRDQDLPADAWIETGAGRAVLVRGQESMIVEPNSRVQLPGAPAMVASGLMIDRVRSVAMGVSWMGARDGARGFAASC